MDKLEKTVAEIIGSVKAGGNATLLRLTAKYDGVRLDRGRIRVPKVEIDRAVTRGGARFKKILKDAAGNVELYHRRQMPRRELFRNRHGASVGWFYRPIERVGIYVPGGTAPLVSTALMTIIPARVAGVGSIVVCTPPGRGGEVNPFILAACRLLGADTVCRVGGAQAIAAMAFGTRSVPKVDLIAGPGNVYVTEAKRQLYGRVGIDMTAGPSEVAIIADAGAPAGYIAADLLSQAEHDPKSRALLLSTSSRLIEKVRSEINHRLATPPVKRPAGAGIRRRLKFVKCRSISDAVARANRIAPEHLEIFTAKPREPVVSVVNAGAVFIGPYSATAIGDYTAGPSHVLPTAGTSRFFSVLSVDTFLKRISYIEYDRASLKRAAAAAEGLAELEGLEAHAESIRVRRKEKGD